jgi:hypothetical protein
MAWMDNMAQTEFRYNFPGSGAGPALALYATLAERAPKV